MGIRDYANKVGSATGRSGGNNFNPGKGRVLITGLKYGEKPEYHKGATFVVEGKIVSCEGFTGIKDHEGKDKPAGNPVGSVVSLPFQFEKYPETAYDGAFNFLIELSGEPREAFDALAKQNKPEEYAKGQWTGNNEIAEFMVKSVEAKLARGMLIDYSTRESKPTKNGYIMTLVNWSHVAQTDEEIAQRCADLDAGKL